MLVLSPLVLMSYSDGICINAVPGMEVQYTGSHPELSHGAVKCSGEESVGKIVLYDLDFL